jgi:putative N6-adenine-specific DNA methylase
MQEALAAAMIMASDWKGDSHFVNPMCGTGTLAIEGLWMALNRAPASLRKNFGFMHLRNFDPMLWKNIQASAVQQEKKTLDIIVRASDKELEMVRAAARNAHVAKAAEWLRIKHAPFQETQLADGGGVVFFNPPYGERLLDREELVPLYQDMGTFIKHQCLGYKVYVISSSVKLLKQVELKPARSWTLFNGALECRLNEYEVF